MTTARATALIADDEPLLREELAQMLAQAWPELEIVAQARNGREAVEQVEALRPAICFLDVHMPGVSGVDAARQIGGRAHVVFVTAFEQYALQAFEQGALDYLVKPVDAARLATTVARLQARLREAQPPSLTEDLLQQLAAQLKAGSAPAPLRWLRASTAGTVRLIHVDEIDFLRSDEKYTLVAWRGEDGKPAEALISVPLKTLVPQLDPAQFAQVHRSVVVNLRAISHVTRSENETAGVHLKGRKEVLPVSRSYLHLFRQM
ncbi:LytTR family DNA-binding domain-containing protein [Ramlibacter sp. XY19]|uniref:LytR/AlgR family response regulator transcription factor n=1 Tax=Ramlibacter paludis TaxID=2908000 RepID=UPI0023DCAFC5|nr:LytTR family DNA-binding domain-containing protein [Ramlibacter paludis]MCG2594419.1 LytTR family DNA-binding domain-containing protein [Ramlibacter paludis]